MSNTVYFFKDRPLFGLDIGPNCLRVVQIDRREDKLTIVGYGSNTFPEEAIKDGVIVDPVSVARAAKELFDRGIRGSIDTRRVALSIPSQRTYTRAIKLPLIPEKEIADAVRLEAEQYIPLPIDELYLDYTVMQKDADGMELYAVASPKHIIDSYIAFAHLVGLEPVAIEASIDAATRLFVQTDFSHVPTVLVDFGPSSADITIVDESIIATGTVGGGGDIFTARISDQLGVTRQEAHVIKTKYGLGLSKKQKEISKALDPLLDDLFKEIRRMIRYYQERYGSDRRISQIVLIGGSANLPGLSDRMTDVLRIPVRNSHPWQKFDYLGVEPLQANEHADFITAAGLALLEPKELFA